MRFLIGSFIACPSDKVQQFTGMMLVINLGIENFGDFELRDSSSTMMASGGG